MLPTVKRYKPFVENVQTARRIRKAVATRLSQQRVGISEPDSLRLRIGQNGTRRAIDVPLPHDPSSGLRTPSTVEDFGDVLAPLPRRERVEEVDKSAETLGLVPTQAVQRVSVSPFRILSRL